MYGFVRTVIMNTINLIWTFCNKKRTISLEYLTLRTAMKNRGFVI